MKNYFYLGALIKNRFYFLLLIGTLFYLHSVYAMEIKNYGDPLSFTLLQAYFNTPSFESVINPAPSLANFSCYQEALPQESSGADDFTIIYCVRNCYEQYATLLKVIITENQTSRAHIHSGLFTHSNTNSKPSNECWEIEYIYTNPFFRGQGYATLLLKKIERCLQQVGVKQLHLIAHNDLISWYQKRGFNTSTYQRIGKEYYLVYKNINV